MFAHSFWERYLAVFDEVVVVARARTLDSPMPPTDWHRMDGPNVTLRALPPFVGPEQYLRMWRQVQEATRQVTRKGDAVIARVPSREGTLILRALPTRDYPFGLEVVADPYDVFAPGGVDHAARRFFRWWDTRKLQRQCARACATAYVTKTALQNRYPPGPDAYAIGCSDVELGAEALAAEPRVPRTDGGPPRILAIASLAQPYKGVDLLIDAVALLAKRDFRVQARIVGGGRLLAPLSARAARLGVADCFSFVGELPAGEAIRRELDHADLFVLPSRAEGLPRVLVEAMARGLPCVSASVGGCPELLTPSVLVPPSDPDALARKIREVASNPAVLSALSSYNLAKSKEYRDEVLQPKREAFYRELRLKTADWLERRSA